VQLTFLLNKGIALSVPLTGAVGLGIILALFFALVAWFVFSVWQRRWVRSSLLFAVLLGAGSNIADRLLYGGVVDYLQVVFPSVINLADVMVVAGIVALLVVPKEQKVQRSEP
jgi:lipoprotein signal peptidase